MLLAQVGHASTGMLTAVLVFYVQSRKGKL